MYCEIVTNVLIDLETFTNKLNFNVRVLRQRNETLLNALYLLRHSTENTLLESVEFVKTSPCTDLTKTDEDATHGLEVEGFVATEDQNETPQLYAKSFDGLRFT